MYCTFLTWKNWYWTVKLATQKVVPLQVLRDTLNCTLPIEIIYNGPREMDQWAVNKFQVPSLLMTCVKLPRGCVFCQSASHALPSRTPMCCALSVPVESGATIA